MTKNPIIHYALLDVLVPRSSGNHFVRRVAVSVTRHLSFLFHYSLPVLFPSTLSTLLVFSLILSVSYFNDANTTVAPFSSLRCF